MEGHSRNHLKHRQETVDYMIRQREDFEPFVEDDIPFEKHGRFPMGRWDPREPGWVIRPPAPAPTTARVCLCELCYSFTQHFPCIFCDKPKLYSWESIDLDICLLQSKSWLGVWPSRRVLDPHTTPPPPRQKRKEVMIADQTFHLLPVRWEVSCAYTEATF